MRKNILNTRPLIEEMVTFIATAEKAYYAHFNEPPPEKNIYEYFFTNLYLQFYKDDDYITPTQHINQPDLEKLMGVKEHCVFFRELIGEDEQ